MRCSHSAGPPNVIPGANDVRSVNLSTLRFSAVVAEIANELRSWAGAAPSAVSPRGASCDRQPLVGGGGIAGGRAPEEAEEAPRVLGHQLHQASLQCRDQELSRTDVQLTLHLESACFQRLRVDLSQDLALGEVERSDRDGVVVEDARDGVPGSPPHANSVSGRQGAGPSPRTPEPDPWLNGIAAAPSWVVAHPAGRSRYARRHADRRRASSDSRCTRDRGGHGRVLRRRHLGHRAVFARTVEAAHERGVRSSR